MVEAELSAEQVENLFLDISELARDVLLMQRAPKDSMASARRTNSGDELAIAKKALLDGAIERVQIRYRWQAKQWIDTLEAKGQSFRLVRIVHSNPADRS